MSRKNGHRARQGVEVIEGSVFFDSQTKDCLLRFDGVWVFSNMLAGDNVLSD